MASFVIRFFLPLVQGDYMVLKSHSFTTKIVVVNLWISSIVCLL
jgi:hypothetical protein